MKRALALVVVLGCGGGAGDDAASPDAASPDAYAGEDLDMQPEDFGCILDWDKVNRFRITNLLGHTAEALAVASSATGGTYPVGTIIQLVPFEASVKRHAGFNAASNDWEFFSLEVTASGTTILDRGTTDVTNQFGGNCFACHSLAEPRWDFTCEQDHGCDPLPLSEAQIDQLQMNDARCP